MEQKITFERQENNQILLTETNQSLLSEEDIFRQIQNIESEKMMLIQDSKRIALRYQALEEKQKKLRDILGKEVNLVTLETPQGE